MNGKLDISRSVDGTSMYIEYVGDQHCNNVTQTQYLNPF